MISPTCSRFAEAPMEPINPVQRFMATGPMEQFSRKAPPGVQLHEGPNGGRYYVTESGEKVYVDDGSGKRYPIAKPAPGAKPPPGYGSPRLKPQLVTTLPHQPDWEEDKDIIRGSFPGDAERAASEKKREHLQRTLDTNVSAAKQQLALTEQFVNANTDITPTQRRRLVRDRKVILKDAEAMKKLFERWEAHPEQRITVPEARQNLTNAQKGLAAVQERYITAYNEIREAKAKKSRGKELKGLKKEAIEASEAREDARRSLQLSEAYAGKIVQPHDSNFRTKVR